MALSDSTPIVVWPHATGASLVYAIVWDQHLTDPITAETYTLIFGVADMTVSTIAPSGSTRKFRAAGGSPGTYRIRHNVTFTSTNTDSRTVELTVSDR